MVFPLHKKLSSKSNGISPQRFLLTPSPLTVDWWRRYCPNHDHDAEDKEIFDDDDDDHDDDNDADM